MPLSPGEYLLGVLALGAIAVSLGVAAFSLRARLAPAFEGATARLAEAVIGLVLLIWVAEGLGSVGALSAVPLVVGCCLVGVAAAIVPTRWGGDTGSVEVYRSLPAAPLAAALAIAVAGVVVVRWGVETQTSLAGGMTGFDTMWYHLPTALSFAQSGSTTGLNFTAPAYLTWFYPANSELFHALGMVTFHRDVLSPVINLGWLALTLLAAWCVGRRWGVGPATLIAVALLLGSGVMTDQAGEARSDIVGLFFLLAAAALLVAGRRRPGELAIAGIAAGAAVATKLTFLAPVVVLSVGVVAIAARGSRRVAGLVWTAATIAAGGYWYARNLIHAGNPLPWLTHLGPVELPGPAQGWGGRAAHSVASELGNDTIWNHWFEPQLSRHLGSLWWAVLAIAAAGMLASLVGRRERVLRLIGAAGIAAAIAYLFSPVSAEGPAGMPTGFGSGLRHLAPALALGLAAAPILPGLRSTARRRLLSVAGLTSLVATCDLFPSPWPARYVPLALLIAAALVVVPVTMELLRRQGRRQALFAAAAALAVLLVIAGGWREQRRYLENRYAQPSSFVRSGLDAVLPWVRHTSDAEIATTAIRQYALAGPDLSNRVQFVGLPGADGSFRQTRTCAEWWRALRRGGYDYLVSDLNRRRPNGPEVPAPTAWTRLDPGATEVLSNPPATVFRIGDGGGPRVCRAHASHSPRQRVFERRESPEPSEADES